MVNALSLCLKLADVEGGVESMNPVRNDLVSREWDDLLPSEPAELQQSSRFVVALQCIDGFAAFHRIYVGTK